MAAKEWRRDALCATLTPEQSDELFFIGPGKSSKRARMFCASCPVKRDCSEFAVMYNEVGIWAGNTDEDRRNLDPFISNVLRATAEAAGILESRNLNDFIPQVRHQTTTDQNSVHMEFDLLESLALTLQIADSLLGQTEEELARVAVQLGIGYSDFKLIESFDVEHRSIESA